MCVCARVSGGGGGACVRACVCMCARECVYKDSQRVLTHDRELGLGSGTGGTGRTGHTPHTALLFLTDLRVTHKHYLHTSGQGV